ncbi:filamentous hemagglutinin N-terminal domain-containing protein [Arcobacter sp. CECT 8985]|uniref:two-partner secretion domain-containing protein n=1 Tax=Arcobacter sp. CECT 8985 TaxID=1935424 RepID=UPI00100BD64C|nr:filamentous hemagglutinin N-terminal domain-containing protein [Arcobacter sp. CECT 8985]RXJ85254.1 hypothetical protein CRU93_11510 [Arcobacter sp. CECT 8985]
MIYNFNSPIRTIKGGKISLIVSAILSSSLSCFGAPTGGTVTSGSATITQNKTVTNINQTSNKATINWKNFSIAKNESVNFKQPNSNSITLNRVIGNEKSIINGTLNANGQVWILNSNGVLFGKNASINTSGIIATTAKLSDEDFNEGKYNFKNATANSVINQGTIEVVNKGSVILASNEVVNEGTIKAIKGSIHLVGTDSYSLNLNGNSLVNLKVDKGVLDAMVSNSGTIISNGGKIYLTTNAVDELLKGVVNNTGILEANSIDDITGHIEVFAHGGEAQVSGSINAESGFIETSGKKIKFSDTLALNAGENGTWLIDPNNIKIVSDASAEANVDSSGAPIYSSLDDTTVLRASTIETQLNNGTNVIVETAEAGTNSQDGDIFLETSVNKTSGGDAVLTLKAHRNIVFANSYTGLTSYGSITSSSNKLHVVLWSDSHVNKDKKNDGSVWIPENSSISTNGGNVWIGGGAGSTIWNGITVGDSYAVGSSSTSSAEGNAIARGASINGDISANGSTSGGNIFINGHAYFGSASARGVSVAGSIITNHQGNITIEGTAKGGSDAVAIGDTANSLTNGSAILRVKEGTILINGHSTSNSSSDSFYLNNGSIIDDNQTGLGTLIINGNNDNILSDSSSYIKIGNLLLKNGSVTLENTNNNISVLAGDNLSSLSYVDADSLTIGTIDTINGITAQGSINIATNTGDLIIDGDINTSDNGTSAIILNAGQSESAGTSTGGDIKYISGNISMGTAGGGRATFYTGSVNGSSISSLISNGNFRYNSDESSNGYDTVNAALGSGFYTLYREQPIIEVTANNDSFVYDGRVYTGGNGAIYSGFVNNDSSSILNGVLNYSGTAQGATKVGTYTISLNGLSNYLGYNINFINGKLDIKSPVVPKDDSIIKIKDSIIPKSDSIPKIKVPIKKNLKKPNNALKIFNENQDKQNINFDFPSENSDILQTNKDTKTSSPIKNKPVKKTEQINKTKNIVKDKPKQQIKEKIKTNKQIEDKKITKTQKNTKISVVNNKQIKQEQTQKNDKTSNIAEQSNEKQNKDNLDTNNSTKTNKQNRYKLDKAQIEIRVNKNGEIAFIQSKIEVAIQDNAELFLPSDAVDILEVMGMSIKTISLKNNKIEINILDKKEDTSKYSATLANGNPLPKYLKIDEKTGKITGTLPKGIKKPNISIKAIGKDDTLRIINLKMRIKEHE